MRIVTLHTVALLLTLSLFCFHAISEKIFDTLSINIFLKVFKKQMSISKAAGISSLPRLYSSIVSLPSLLGRNK